MSQFDFETFEIDDNENLNVHNAANFEIFLLATTALSFLIKDEENAKDRKDGEIPQFISYSRWAVEKISDISASKDINNTDPEIQQIVKKNLDALCFAKQQLANNPTRLKIGGFEEEFWWFYTEAMWSMVDSAKILKDTHTKSKGCMGEYDHYTRIQFKHGTNTWTYNIRIKESRNIEVKGFINGKSANLQEGDKLACDEMITVDLTLKNIARSIALEKSFLFLSELAQKDKAAVSKARTIAIVMGGDYKNYLLAAKNFINSFEDILNTTTMKKEHAAHHILGKQFRGSESQLNQIAAILVPQSTWH